jgi:uncharacterized sulfatase
MFRIRAMCAVVALLFCACSPGPERPNILWITSEDTGPHLGAYGDAYADTPALDELASKGMIYRNVWSTLPVCAPARTAIIAGIYPVSLGAQHMRSMVEMPPGVKMFPRYLREAGYYTSNNVKEDYNLRKPEGVWDDSSRDAHWQNRNGLQPFFAVFNFTTTHESQIRKRPHTPVHDPAKVRLPAYHPDAPEIRQDWAQYYDKITEMDAQAAGVLRQLAEDKLTEDTIVFYYGDHGPGIARSKRYPYDSGLRVGLIVHVPEKYRHLAPADWAAGSVSERPVSFVDLAPTVLSLAGVRPPDSMQGKAFLGPFATPAPEYVFGFRGRMDERYDLMRTARDQRYVYVRNYMPHRIYGQHVAYLFETPTTQVWHRLYAEGKLKPPQTHFWETKPYEELYDLQSDSDETRNLAASPGHAAILERFRNALDAKLLEIRDTGFLPENEIHERSKGRTPGEMARDDRAYPLARIKAVAEMAASMKAELTPRLVEALSDEDSAIRYWGALGLLMRGEGAVAGARQQLAKALEDPAPSVRIAAGEALGRYGSAAEARRALNVLLELADAEKNGAFVGMMAMNAIDYMDRRALPARAAIAKLPRKDPNSDARFASNIGRIIDKTLADLK